MSGGKIDDAAAAKDAADTARHLPRFVQLLARQAAGMTHATSQAVEQRGAGKPLQVTIGEPCFGGEGERQAYSVRRRRVERKSHPSDVTPAHFGGNEPRYEEIAMMSSSDRLVTTGFINSAAFPALEPYRMSKS